MLASRLYSKLDTRKVTDGIWGEGKCRMLLVAFLLSVALQVCVPIMGLEILLLTFFEGFQSTVEGGRSCTSLWLWLPNVTIRLFKMEASPVAE